MATSERMGDGGPAFPVVATTPRDIGGAGNYTTIGDVTSSGGMTLRDYFAAKAMQAGLTNPDIGDTFARAMDAGKVDEGMAVLGKYAYQIADAMLLERSK